MKPTLKPSDLARESQRLIKAGKMPTLQQVMNAVAEVKAHPYGTPVADFDDDAETLLLRNRKGGSQ